MLVRRRSLVTACLYCMGLLAVVVVLRAHFWERGDARATRLFVAPPVVPKRPRPSTRYNRSYAVVSSSSRESIWSVTELVDPSTLTDVRNATLHRARQRLDDEYLEILGSGVDSEPVRILIVAYFRSGSSFLGQLLNHYPGAYYLFEPLQIVSGMGRVGGGGKSDPRVERARATRLLEDLLHCRHFRSSSYFEYTFRHRKPLTHNVRLMNACESDGALCYDPQFLDRFCRLHPVHVTKTVRLPLSAVGHLLHEFPDLGVVYLTRDPRGIYHSRRSLAWCRLVPSCIDPRLFCEDMLADVDEALELQRSYPEHFLPLRYEDLTLDPHASVGRLLAFLGLRSNVQIDWFVDSHTRPDPQSIHDNDPYSTFRNAALTAVAWKEALSPMDVQLVQKHCGDVIQQLGYSLNEQ